MAVSVVQQMVLEELVRNPSLGFSEEELLGHLRNLNVQSPSDEISSLQNMGLLSIDALGVYELLEPAYQILGLGSD